MLNGANGGVAGKVADVVVVGDGHQHLLINEIVFVSLSHGSYMCSYLPRPRTGLRGIVFTLSVWLSVCVSVCLFLTSRFMFNVMTYS